MGEVVSAVLSVTLPVFRFIATGIERIRCMKTSHRVGALIAPILLQGISPFARSLAAEAPGATANGTHCKSGVNWVTERGLVSGATEVPVETNTPTMPGHPLTSVVVTQCNLIVAVYLTMPDGKLLRFDKSSSIPAAQLLAMAHAAAHSERVEVSRNEVGSAGYESRGPV